MPAYRQGQHSKAPISTLSDTTCGYCKHVQNKELERMLQLVRHQCPARLDDTNERRVGLGAKILRACSLFALVALQSSYRLHLVLAFSNNNMNISWRERRREDSKLYTCKPQRGSWNSSTTDRLRLRRRSSAIWLTIVSYVP